MRRRFLVLTALLPLAYALPALAEVEEYEAEEYEVEEYEEPAVWHEEFTEANRALGGLNGIITWPADPVMLVVHVSEAFEDAPLAPVTGRFLGLGGGLLLGVYRLTMGVLDVVFQPIPFMPTLSPLPRFKVIPWFVHEDE